MLRDHRLVVILCLAIAGLAAGRQARSEHYFSLDSAVSVAISNDRLTIQLDSTEVAPMTSSLLADHPCRMPHPLAVGLSVKGNCMCSRRG